MAFLNKHLAGFIGVIIGTAISNLYFGHDVYNFLLSVPIGFVLVVLIRNWLDKWRNS